MLQSYKICVHWSTTSYTIQGQGSLPTRRQPQHGGLYKVRGVGPLCSKDVRQDSCWRIVCAWSLNHLTFDLLVCFRPLSCWNIHSSTSFPNFTTSMLNYLVRCFDNLCYIFFLCIWLVPQCPPNSCNLKPRCAFICAPQSY